MKIQILSSSSSGNSSYIEMGNKKFLIDVGLGFNDIINKLECINVLPEEIDFILITHAHIDHVKSLHCFYRKYKTKIYMSSSTFEEYFNKEKIKYCPVDEIENIDEIKILKIPISHDKKGFGYILEYKDDSIVYITDTGMIHKKYHKYLINKKVYIFESNHDVYMLMNGIKDYTTKTRVVGDYGHLSNEMAAKYLSEFVGDNTKLIMLAHISDNDNTHELAYETNRNAIDKKIDIKLSYKDKVSEFVEI